MNEALHRYCGAILGLALIAGAVGAQPLPEGTAACIATLVAAEDSAGPGGPESFYAGEYCEAYVAALEASAWNDNLPPDDAYFLEREGLESLVGLTSDYAGPAPDRLSTAPLAGIVSELEPFVPQPEPTFWQRFGDWLESWFVGEDGTPTWLGEWLESLAIPESWQRPILYVIAALAVLAVLAILINELRLGGSFVGRTARALRTKIETRLGRGPRVPSFDDVQAAAETGRKVELLFAIVVDRLRRRHHGLLSPTLTHRELVRATRQLDETPDQRVDALANAAERVTYADWQPDRQAFEQLLEGSRALVQEIDDAVAEPA